VLRKGYKELLAEANAMIDTVSVTAARHLHAEEDVVFIDIREGHERALGHVAGSIHAPRGFLEFIADPQSQMHNPVFASGKRLVLYCASGGRSTLAAKTLHDMGVPNVSHMAGGFTAWAQAGGPVER
jgi:rhodanese-related sulfurtransferase